MRIAILSDTVFPTPMAGGHGLGRIVWQLAELLRARAHDVTLFAKTQSTFSGRLITVDAQGYEGEALLAQAVAREHRQYPFDVLLDHGHMNIISDMMPDYPVVNVYHDIYQAYARCPVLLSKGQRALMPADFEGAAIIPNALMDKDLTPDYRRGEYALFMGALSEIKNPLLAVEACAKAGVKLVMAGHAIVGKWPVSGLENIEYVGAVHGKRKVELLQNARVFLQLGHMESFGLTTLEAMLCGTPVVAWPSGGSLDQIKYGVNGVFVPPSGDKAQAIADAIDRAWDMDRGLVVEAARQQNNVEGHVSAYESVLADCMRGEWW